MRGGTSRRRARGTAPAAALLAAAVLAAALLVAGCSGSTQGSSAKHSSEPAGVWSVASRHESLPLNLPTGDAAQVLTVAAPSQTSTTARLQAWVHTGGRWARYGPQVTAHLGRGGLSAHEQEAQVKTPMGAFTLTQAFGRFPNPGTRLPYFQTTPDDWWISQFGPLYNTHQKCIAKCPFRTGTPNAQLFYVVPQYDLAVAIDYNRFPVVQGAGSGIFLHVSANRPTNGCVSIPRPDLVQIMRWLDPAAHPKILIGVA